MIICKSSSITQKFIEYKTFDLLASIVNGTEQEEIKIEAGFGICNGLLVDIPYSIFCTSSLCDALLNLLEIDDHKFIEQLLQAFVNFIMLLRDNLEVDILEYLISQQIEVKLHTIEHASFTQNNNKIQNIIKLLYDILPLDGDFSRKMDDSGFYDDL